MPLRETDVVHRVPPSRLPPLATNGGSGTERAAGLLLGALLDAVIGDPTRGHPVAAFGKLATRLERRMWSDSRRRGAAYTLVCTGLPVLLGVAAERSARSPWARIAMTGAATWAVLGARSLAYEGTVMADLLRHPDLTAARARLAHLAGRDPSGLGAGELARASVESLAENTSDAVVAPLLWGALAGVPGLLGYRAVNTLDAMVGHRTPRHERFGWACARLDDAANYLPARASAVLAASLSGRPRAALAAWRRDADQHPSPNAGPVEAAFAGGLGVRLGGTNVYAGRAERRGTLGDGPPASADDVPRAVRLAVAVDGAAVVLACGLAVALGRRAGSSRRPAP